MAIDCKQTGVSAVAELAWVSVAASVIAGPAVATLGTWCDIPFLMRTADALTLLALTGFATGAAVSWLQLALELRARPRRGRHGGCSRPRA